MYAAYQWQVLEAVLPLKTSYIGSEQCLHGQSLFIGTRSTKPTPFGTFIPMLKFLKKNPSQNNAYFHCFIVQKNQSKSKPKIRV